MKRIPVACFIALVAGGLVSTASEVMPEPGSGPVEAGAILVSVQNSPGGPRALVRIEVLSNHSNADVVVTPVAASAADGTPRPLGPQDHAQLLRGVPSQIFLTAQLQPGRENHLYFKALSQMADGTTAENLVYLRVNLDPALEPEIVGDYVQYRAGDAAAQTGGREPW